MKDFGKSILLYDENILRSLRTLGDCPTIMAAQVNNLAGLIIVIAGVYNPCWPGHSTYELSINLFFCSQVLLFVLSVTMNWHFSEELFFWDLIIFTVFWNINLGNATWFLHTAVDKNNLNIQNGVYTLENETAEKLFKTAQKPYCLRRHIPVSLT